VRVASGELQPEAIDSAALGGELCIADLPEPDLFIRTGGEQRISNYLLWQLAYTELYFTDLLWPDFDAAAFPDSPLLLLADAKGPQLFYPDPGAMGVNQFPPHMKTVTAECASTTQISKASYHT